MDGLVHSIHILGLKLIAKIEIEYQSNQPFSWAGFLENRTQETGNI